MLDTKKMIGISVADYIMEIWDYIILLGNDVCLAIPYTGSKGDLRAELEDFLDSQYFMNDEYV